MGCCISCQIEVPRVDCNVYKHYIFDLEKNLRSLKDEVKKVELLRDDILKKIVREEDRGLERLALVQVWITRVETLTQEAYEVLDGAEVERNRLCFNGSCTKSFKSSYEYGKKVYRVLIYVKKIIETGHFDVVAEGVVSSSVSLPVFVGLDNTFERARRLLMEDEVGVLGIYGMGGTGKTTLLSRLHNEISVQEVSPFDTMLWIHVSKSVQIHRIQDDVGKLLFLYNEEWGRKSLSQKAISIYSILRRKRFLVMLDDLWERLDLMQIGIPLPTMGNGCKIVITSRSRSVCEVMGANASIEVPVLEKDDAWELFRNTVGETTLQSHPEIHRLARIIVDRCGGFPLVLKVLGGIMASKTSVQEWHHALEQLIEPTSNLTESIFLVLRRSYDALEGKQLKLCFLFCALFPEDQEIRKEDLVELWIGEGIIDGNNDQDRAKNQGFEIIGVLLATNLLNEVGESRDKVVLHDIIREVALYIASHPDKDKENIIVESFTQVGRLSDIKNWRDVGRVSLVGDDIKTISGHFDCPKLKTLLLRDTKLESISPEFFSSLPVLLVLDLSSNKHLNILPDAISELASLRYLNLSSTGIKRLPLGLSELKKLTYLNLEHTHMLKDITRISDLVNIQELRLCDSGFRASSSLVEELQLLEHLEILTITLQDEDVVQQFQSSPKLARCTQGFYLHYCAALSSISITSLSSSLRCLDVQDSYIPEMMIDPSARGGEAMVAVSATLGDAFFRNLNEVRLDGCNGLRELTWLLFAPMLTALRVVQSRDLEEIISKEKAHPNIVPFERLEFLALEGLDKLRSIYWHPLPLPELREIKVRSCPGLTRLPVNSQSAKEHNLVVSAEKEFMQRIEWEDEETRERFFPRIE